MFIHLINQRCYYNQLINIMLKQYTHQDLTLLLKSEYGIDGELQELGGYTDRNYLVTHHISSINQKKYILKISSSLQNQGLIKIQNRVLKCLKQFDTKMKCRLPVLLPTIKGQEMIIFEQQGKHNHIRLLQYIEGRQLQELSNPTVELMRQAGQLTARLDMFLQNLSRQCQIQQLIANVNMDAHYFNICTFNQHYQKYNKYLNPEIVQFINQCKLQFNQLLPILLTIPKQLIHNDICLTNILVNSQNGQYNLSGLIDFSSIIYTHRIIELAILCARINLCEIQPLRNILIIVKSFNRERKLSEQELIVLFPLIKVRLAFLCLLSSYLASTKQQEHPYFIKCKQGHLRSFLLIRNATTNSEFLTTLRQLISEDK